MLVRQKLFVSVVIAMIFRVGLLLSAEAPAFAASLGYTSNSFTSVFNSNTVDMKRTYEKGYKWYVWNLHGGNALPENIILNSDESVTLLGDRTGPNGQITTAASVYEKGREEKGNNYCPGKYVGNVFGNGGYFEAEFKFNPDDVVSNQQKERGFPAWWALAVEMSVFSDNVKWPGQNPAFKDQTWLERHLSWYINSIEVDIFEYYFWREKIPCYSGTMHNWYGQYRKTGPGWGRKGITDPEIYHRKVPSDTNFSEYHKYGFLWVPAKGGSNGYAKFYFDRNEVGKTVLWSENQEALLPPPSAPYVFSILDRQHLNLILGTGRSMPMTVREVNVWQSPKQ